jgi:hypothetical protein
MVRRWIGLLVLVAVGCGSDDGGGAGFAGAYRVIEVRQYDNCNGEGAVIDTDPTLELFDLVELEVGVEWRTCSAEDTCEGTGEPEGAYPRRLDEETADGWRAWTDATSFNGTVCNYAFFESALGRAATDEAPEAIVLAERSLRETRTMDVCDRPADVTVDSASCLSQRTLLAVRR